MSGFEIAGVVLGALPLVIHAFEFYAEGAATAKRFWRYKSELRSLVLQINTEQGILINTLEQLLTGIIQSEQIAGLLADPAGATWRASDVDAKLKDRLRGVYGIYLDNVRGMETSLKRMMDKLALDPDGKPQFSDQRTFKQEYRRLRFSIGKAEYADMLSSLKNYNQALTRLTKQSLELEPTRTKARSRCPNFEAFRDYTRNLYNTLRSSIQCVCDGHKVNLRLEHRPEDLGKSEAVEHVPFRVVFSYEHTINPASSTPAWPSWSEVNIRCLAESANQVPSSTSTGKAPSPQSTQRRVRFGSNDARSLPTSSGSSSMGPNPLRDQPTGLSTVRIQDLCKAIAKLKQPQRDLCLGYLLDELQRKHALYVLHGEQCDQQPWAVYTLEDVLTSNASTSRRLSQQDKLRIALDLASSVLQLYNTPWLSKHWEKEDVLFFQRPGVPLTSIYEHPFVCRKLASATANGCISASQDKNRVIRNQTLWKLGVLLIELWYGKPIEQLQLPCDLDCSGTPGVTWCTVERVVKNELESDAGLRYSEAVRRCVRCDFDQKASSLHDQVFQEAVYYGVVAMLEKTLHQFISLD